MNQAVIKALTEKAGASIRYRTRKEILGEKPDIKKYLGEIDIQRGNAYRSGRHLNPLIEIFEAPEERMNLSHCYGLLSLERMQSRDYEGAARRYDIEASGSGSKITITAG